MSAATPPDAAVALIEPKYPHNVGQALRACAAYGVRRLYFTGARMEEAIATLSRLPREERLRGYRSVQLAREDRVFDALGDFVPVAIEVRKDSVPLPIFQHPERALYVFGPEDGGLAGGVLARCHHFVAIPTAHCLNLSMAVGTVLYDRQAKREPERMLDMAASEGRGWFEMRDFLPERYVRDG